MKPLTQTICSSLLLAIIAMGFTGAGTPAHAGYVHGYVYTRSVVINDAGNLTWGEFNPSTGAYVKNIGEAVGVLDPTQWRVMSGDEYRCPVRLSARVVLL